MDNVGLQDIWPATVRAPSGERLFTKARVLAHNGSVLVLVRALNKEGAEPTHDPGVFIGAEVEDGTITEGPRVQRYSILTADGEEVYVVDKADTCSSCQQRRNPVYRWVPESL